MRAIAVFILFSCFLLVRAQDLHRHDTSVPSGNGYTTAVFSDSGRLEKIRAGFEAADRMFREYAAKNHFPAIAYGIILDGKLAHAGATGVLNTETRTPARTTSLFRIASMTKSFTAMAILRLRDDGKLSLSDAAAKYIPEMKNFKYPTADAPPITIENLLTMTAGFPEDNPWGDRQLQDTDAELIDFLRNGVSFSNIPGQAFEYSNLGYAILGNIVTRVSGMPYQQYITETILKPLGMRATVWDFSTVAADQLAQGYRWEDEKWKREPMLRDGAYGAMGGLITSIEDFSRYVSLHLCGVDEPDNAVLKRSSIREMYRPHFPTLVPEAKRPDGTPCPILYGYGYGLGYRRDCDGRIRISHSGGLPGFGSEFRFYPELGIGVVSFANRTYAGAGSINARVLDTLVSIGGLKPRELPPSGILLKRKEQLMKVLTAWDDALAQQIFAENFFLDRSRDAWIKNIAEVKKQSGGFVSAGPIVPENQLRGTFTITGNRKDIEVFFTLTPEADPKIQQLDLAAVDNGQ